MSKSIVATVLIGLLGLGATGCASHTGEGALLGGAGGALVGAAIGSASHSRAGEGALLGGAIGAIGGAIVGNEADKQEHPYYGYDGGGPAPAAPAYDHPVRYYESDYGYSSPRVYTYARYEQPRRYYEYRTVRTYGPRGRYVERYYCR
jgi:hypothetical protein